jgi:predicted XRE-type DNA-binding protein
MSDRAFKSVWDAIEENPAQAANMKHRSALMMAVSEHIKAKGLNQTEAARLFAVSQPRISDLMRGKIGLFSIDTLVAMLAAAGIEIDIRVRPKRVRTSNNLVGHTTPKSGRRRVAA